MAPKTIAPGILGGRSSIGKKVVLWWDELDDEVVGTVIAFEDFDGFGPGWKVQLEPLADCPELTKDRVIALSQGPFTPSGEFRVIRMWVPPVPRGALSQSQARAYLRERFGRRAMLSFVRSGPWWLVKVPDPTLAWRYMEVIGRGATVGEAVVAADAWGTAHGR